MFSAKSVINFGLALALATMATLAVTSILFDGGPVPDLPVAVAIAMGSIGLWALFTARQLEREAAHRRTDLQSYMPLSPEEEAALDKAANRIARGAISTRSSQVATGLPIDHVDDLRQIRRCVELHRTRLLAAWWSASQLEQQRRGAGNAAWERELDAFFAEHRFSTRVMNRVEVRAALTAEVDSLAEREKDAIRAQRGRLQAPSSNSLLQGGTLAPQAAAWAHAPAHPGLASAHWHPALAGHVTHPAQVGYVPHFAQAPYQPLDDGDFDPAPPPILTPPVHATGRAVASAPSPVTYDDRQVREAAAKVHALRKARESGDAEVDRSVRIRRVAIGQ